MKNTNVDVGYQNGIVVSEPIIRKYGCEYYRFCVVRSTDDALREWCNVEKRKGGMWFRVRDEDIERSKFLYATSAKVYRNFQAQKGQQNFSFDLPAREQNNKIEEECNMEQKNLHNLVTAWAKKEADAVGSSPAEVLRDLVEHHGAGAGMVEELIYPNDVKKFLDEYHDNIVELVEYTGIKPQDIKGWNERDLFCLSSENRIFLAQWAFEQEAAFVLNEITQQQEEKANEVYGMGM